MRPSAGDMVVVVKSCSGVVEDLSRPCKVVLKEALALRSSGSGRRVPSHTTVVDDGWT